MQSFERSGLQEGDVLKERYRMLSVLGAGGMGKVFLAEDLRLKGKKWAVKETLPLLGDADGFLREAELLARLEHPMLPQIVDFYGPEDKAGHAYVVMEVIPGTTLESALKKRGRLTDDTVVRIAAQLCDVLSYLHGVRPEPVIFRDVKPSNIMLDENDRIRLIDFGIARSFKPLQKGDTLPLGTIGFAAPEQLRGEQTDPRADLYSLGAVLYYLLSGGLHASLVKRPLAELRPDAPPPLLRMTERLLQDRPERRPQSAAEAQELLRPLFVRWGGALPLPAAAKASLPPSAGPRLVLVGGLYAGAGSTFAALCLAKALDRAGIPHAVCEHPAVEPELYSLLFGEHKAPKGYLFAADCARNGTNSAAPEWTEGHTAWFPSAPDAEPDEIGTEPMWEWLNRVRRSRSVVICDVSHNWLQESVGRLCLVADELLITADPSPAKLARPGVRKLLAELINLERSGCHITWIANRHTASPRSLDWSRLLPAPARVKLPIFAPSVVLEAQWRGKGVPCGEAELTAMIEAYSPLLQEWFPESSFNRKHSGRSWLPFRRPLAR